MRIIRRMRRVITESFTKIMKILQLFADANHTLIFLAYKSLILTVYFTYREQKKLQYDPFPIARLKVISINCVKGHSRISYRKKRFTGNKNLLLCVYSKSKISRFFSSLNKTADLSFLSNLLNRF